MLLQGMQAWQIEQSSSLRAAAQLWAWAHQPHAASAAGTRGQGPSVATGGTDATAASGRATRGAAAKQVRLGVQHDAVHCPQPSMLESINDSHGMDC